MEGRMEQLWDKYIRNSKGWKLDPIAKVHPRIYIGSANSVDILTFHTYNITHAINCAEKGWNSRWLETQFPERYACMEATDSADYDITSVYPKFEQTMNEFLSNPQCGSIYIHCQCGINRSAFLLLIYMCRKFQYSMESVVKNILLQRPCCFRNVAFRKQVVEYIKKLE